MTNSRRLELHSWAMAGVLLGLWAILAILPKTSSVFLTEYNLVSLTVHMSHIAVVAVGMTLVIIIRGIDLSVGAGVALCGVVAALLQVDYNMPAWIAIMGAVGTGAALGFWQGVWISRFAMPAFVVTLAGFNAFRGLALVLSDARGLAVKDDFDIVADNLPRSFSIALIAFGTLAYLAWSVHDTRRRRRVGVAVLSPIAMTAQVVAALGVGGFMMSIYSNRGMPMPVFLAVAAVAVGIFLTQRTRFGRHVYAIGGNPEAARLAGINVERTTIWVYVFIGILTGIAGVILAGRVGGVTPGNTGNLLELDVIAAVVIGGTSLSGGRGSILGAVLGAMVFATLSKGMNLLEVNSNWQLILKGLILMAAVLIDVLSKRKRT